jgi:hypothetical protein
MATINNNTWYYLPVANVVSYQGNDYNSYVSNEYILNTKSSLSTANYNNQVLYGNSNYSPIAINNYGVVCGTRVLPLVNGTFNFNIMSSSGNNIDYYESKIINDTITIYHTVLSGAANSVITRNISMNSNIQYTILLTQQNSNINSSMFINTIFNNGNLLNINNAFTGTLR